MPKSVQAYRKIFFELKSGFEINRPKKIFLGFETFFLIFCVFFRTNWFTTSFVFISTFSTDYTGSRTRIIYRRDYSNSPVYNPSISPSIITWKCRNNDETCCESICSKKNAEHLKKSLKTKKNPFWSLNFKTLIWARKIFFGMLEPI